MYIGDIEITKREILVSIIIIAVMITFGIIISNIITDSVIESNEKYYKALKINNDENMFEYAIDTNVGYTLAQGKIEAIEGVSSNDLEGKFFSIKKTKEVYTMHTRQVKHESGNTVYYTTEIYYTWDFYGIEDFHIDKFKFLGEEFNYGTIKFNNYKFNKIVYESSSVRYIYETIPYEFDGTLFTYINNNTINNNDFLLNKDITTIIKEKENSQNVANIIFWIIWIIIIIGIVTFFIANENKYLED